MKTLFLAILFSILAFSAGAQTNNSLVFGKAIVKYQKMETAGTVLTILGGSALFTGNYLYWKTYNDRNIDEQSISKAHTYRNIMLGGLGLMAAGIPLLAIGKSNERHITIDARVVSFNGYLSANGMGFKVRF